MNRLKKKNTIIALAVLAVFIVCVSIAKISVASPFDVEASTEAAAEDARQASAEQEDPVPMNDSLGAENIQPKSSKPTLTRSASITTSADTETFAAVRDLDLATLNRVMSGRYILNYLNFDPTKIRDVYGESNEYYYDTYAVPYPIFDSKALVEFNTFATDIRTSPGTYYDDSTNPIPPDLLWLVKHSTPYLSLEDARSYYVSLGYPSSDAMMLTEEDIFYATQLVIWRQMHGITTWDWGPGFVADYNPLVPSLYALLTANLSSDVSVYTDVTITPDSSLTLKGNTWGPFNLSVKALTNPTDVTVPYNITLMADKPGLEVLIVDEAGNVLPSVPSGGKFYIRFTNYNSLPADTTYTIRIDAVSTQAVRIQRVGMMETKEVLVENQGLPTTPLLYGYTIQSPLRNSLTLSFTTTKYNGK